MNFDEWLKKETTNYPIFGNEQQKQESIDFAEEAWNAAMKEKIKLPEKNPSKDGRMKCGSYSTGFDHGYNQAIEDVKRLNGIE